MRVCYRISIVLLLTSCLKTFSYILWTNIHKKLFAYSVAKFKIVVYAPKNVDQDHFIFFSFSIHRVFVGGHQAWNSTSPIDVKPVKPHIKRCRPGKNSPYKNNMKLPHTFSQFLLLVVLGWLIVVLFYSRGIIKWSWPFLCWNTVQYWTNWSRKEDLTIALQEAIKQGGPWKAYCLPFCGVIIIKLWNSQETFITQGSHGSTLPCDHSHDADDNHFNIEPVGNFLKILKVALKLTSLNDNQLKFIVLHSDDIFFIRNPKKVEKTLIR